jgi:hypothetical protein
MTTSGSALELNQCHRPRILTAKALHLIPGCLHARQVEVSFLDVIDMTYPETYQSKTMH